MQFKEKIQVLAESFTLKEELDPLTQKPVGVKIQGLAITPDKPTRNKVAYSRESLMATHKSLIGKPFLDSHQDTSIRNSPPFGHVTNTWMTEKGMFYEVDIDPAEQVFINKAKRGDISGVSIQVLVEDVDQQEGFVRANVQEFLELSAVLIPGDGDTSMKIAEAFKGKPNIKKTKEQTGKAVPVAKVADKDNKKYIKGPSVDDAKKKKVNKKPEPNNMMKSDQKDPKSKGKPSGFMKGKESYLSSEEEKKFKELENRLGDLTPQEHKQYKDLRAKRLGLECVICPVCKKEVTLKDNSNEIIMLEKHETLEECVKCPHCKTEMKLKEEFDGFQYADKLGGDKFLTFLKNNNLRTITMDQSQIDQQFKQFQAGKQADVGDEVPEDQQPLKLAEDEMEDAEKVIGEMEDQISELDSQPLPIPEEQQPMLGQGEVDDEVNGDEVEPPMPGEEVELPGEEQPIVAPDAEAEPVMDVEQPPEVPMGDEQQPPMNVEQPIEDEQQIDGQEIPMGDEVQPVAKYKLQIPHFNDKYFDVEEAIDEEDAEKKYYDLRKKGKMPRIVDIETGECVMEALEQGAGTQPQAGSGKGKGDIQKSNDKDIGEDGKPVAGTPSMPNPQEPAEGEELSEEIEDASTRFNPLNGCKVCGHKPLDGEGPGEFECPNCGTKYKLDKDMDEYEFTTPNPTEVNKEKFKLRFECLECKHSDVDDRFPEQTDGLVYCPECQGVNLKSIKEKQIGGR